MHDTDSYYRPILLSLSLWRCSAHLDHTVVLLLAWPGVSVCMCVCVCLWVCVASISLGRRVAPCCDCVYSFVMLWATLPSAHNWHCHQMERWGKRKGWQRAGTVTTNQLLSPLLSFVIGQTRTFSLKTCCLSSSQHCHTDPGLKVIVGIIWSVAVWGANPESV